MSTTQATEKKPKYWTEAERKHLLDNYRILSAGDLAKFYNTTTTAIIQQYVYLFRGKEGEQLRHELTKRNSIKIDRVNKSSGQKGWRFLTDGEQQQIVEECKVDSITKVSLRHNISTGRAKLVLEKYGQPIINRLQEGIKASPKNKVELKPIHAEQLRDMQQRGLKGQKYYWMGTARIIKDFALVPDKKEVHVITEVGTAPNNYQKVIRIPVRDMPNQIKEFKRI